MFVGVLIASLLLLVHSQSTAVLGVELAGTGAVLAADYVGWLRSSLGGRNRPGPRLTRRQGQGLR